jgi:hypothetical protein
MSSVAPDSRPAGDDAGIITVRQGTRFIISPVLARAGCVHAFGTKDLGSSHAAAHARLKQAFPGVREIATVRQVHGRDAVHARSEKDARRLRRIHADVIIVSAAGIAAAVRTADCAPVLVFDPVHNAAAAVHSGWKGAVVRAAEAAVTTLRDKFGSRPADLVAGIGPCIMPCHYQVDDPVIRGITQSLAGRAVEVLAPDGPGKARLDLSRANRIILEQAGVLTRNIDEARICTCCRKDLFFSYRRQGKGVPSLYHFIAVEDEGKKKTIK